MKFTKMQGIGNDYVYVNCFEEKVEKPSEAAKKVSDRHFGIGSDGLILIKPSQVADCEMEMYNMDGSLGAMCGNGIRCVAKYVYEHGIVKKTNLTVATTSGIKDLALNLDEDGRVGTVRVNMGAPALEAGQIPVDAGLVGKNREGTGGSQEENSRWIIQAPIEISDHLWEVTAVSMGNPHAVTYVADPEGLEIEKIGPEIENHPAFPDRVNAEFVKVEDSHTLRMRVWERGAGETLACGTGACAAAVASILTGQVDGDAPVKVLLKGGELEVFWDRDKNVVFMTGPAQEVFHGEILL